MTDQRGGRAIAIFLAFILPVLSALLFLFEPGRTRLFPPCPFRLSTGLYCPGCGTMRAIHHLLDGNIVGAMSMNPLMVLALPALGLLLYRRTWAYKLWVPWMAFVILIGYAMARNIRFSPFTMLAPE